ncbi:hypothetical protein [Pseudonocardia humida]|uniref:Uncharacterized protein n=1 Tax=Pseudonocardia humida TaxID=2800819 RepID=A0ABT0ZUB7_9PSEU|nr:hypothetical protein [Pseudonocardia humida]MCO1654273.1 hypothetical protein [Pseudonocardia humida]
MDPTTLSMLVAPGWPWGPRWWPSRWAGCPGAPRSAAASVSRSRRSAPASTATARTRDGRACRQQVKRASKWDSDGDVKRYEWVDCSCRHYDGPEPLSSIAGWRPPEPLP